MPRLKRRDKVISIRLSNEEFDQFQSWCIAQGGNSISELARHGMKLLVSQGMQSGQAAIESRVDQMQDRVMTLDREVARLANELGLAKAKESQ